MAESRSEPQNAFVILPVRQVFFLFVFLIDVYILFAEALCSGPDKLEQVGYGFRNLSFNVFFHKSPLPPLSESILSFSAPRQQRATVMLYYYLYNYIIRRLICQEYNTTKSGCRMRRQPGFSVCQWTMHFSVSLSKMWILAASRAILMLSPVLAVERGETRATRFWGV